MNRFTHVRTLGIVALLVGGSVAAVQAAEKKPPVPTSVPVTGMEGWGEFNNRVSGLALAVEDAGGPALRLLSADPLAAVAGAIQGSSKQAGHLLPGPIRLGCILTGSRADLTTQQVNSVSNTLGFGDEPQRLTVTVTRLSPAIVVESKSSAVEFFAPEPRPARPTPADVTPPAPGTVKPLRWATPDASGKVLTGVLGKQPTPELPFRGFQDRFARAPSLAPEQPALPPTAGLGQSWLLLWYGADSPLVSSKLSSAYTREPIYPLTRRIGGFQQSDVPLLLVFQNTPKAIELRKEGDAARFVVSFDGEAGRIAVLPLFGHDLRPSSETEQWLADFPQDLKARCDRWASVLGEVPVNVRELAAYDQKQDRVTFTETFEYLRVREGGQRMAPLPAMLALAHSQGLKTTFSAEPVDLKLSTEFGPAMGIRGDSYTWSMDGLAKAAFAQRVIGPSTPKAEELQKELVAEVDRMIEAGHLAPWMCLTRRFSFVHFRDPSETLCLLSQVLPALPPDRQEKLRAYLRTEYTAYPPHKVQAISLDDGVRRENRNLPFKSRKYGDLGYKLSSVGAPTPAVEPAISIFRAHGAACYYEATGQKPPAEELQVWRQMMTEALAGREWSTLGWYWGKRDRQRAYSRKPVAPGELPDLLRLVFFSVTPRQVHRDATGLIGYLRLCRLADQPSEPEAWAQLARLSTMRFALARYGRYLATSGLVGMPEDAQLRAYLARSADFSKPENHIQQPLCVDQHGVTVHAAVSRELATYLMDRRADAYGTTPMHETVFLDLSPQFARVLGSLGLNDDAQRFLAFFGQMQPNWYAAYADGSYRAGSELAFMQPSDSHQLFMGHAWLAGTAPEKLERWIDQPWAPTGDLFYMHKLAETILAYRGATWGDAGAK